MSAGPVHPERPGLRDLHLAALLHLLGGAVLACAGLTPALLPVVHHPVVSLGILMAGYGGSVSLSTFTNPVLAELVPPHQRAALLGAFNGLGVSAGAVSPIVSGMLLDASGSAERGYSLVFLCFGALMALGGLCFALLVDPERDRPDPAAERSPSKTI
ncbi:MFS transporter [Streptomyces sp. NPDC004752]